MRSLVRNRNSLQPSIMNTRFVRFIVTSVFGLLVVGGCAANATSRRDRGQINTESQSEMTKAKVQAKSIRRISLIVQERERRL
jgi:hypothetical protein